MMASAPPEASRDSFTREMSGHDNSGNTSPLTVTMAVRPAWHWAVPGNIIRALPQSVPMPCDSYPRQPIVFRRPEHTTTLIYSVRISRVAPTNLVNLKLQPTSSFGHCAQACQESQEVTPNCLGISGPGQASMKLSTTVGSKAKTGRF